MRVASFFIAVFAVTSFAWAQAPPMVAEVETRGAGPINMVLIPGLGCDWTVWEAFMERNAARYTMHAVTLAGFGGTPPAAADDEPGWLDGAVESIARLILDEGLTDAVVVGHSMGGHLAVRLAVEKPELVAKAVNVDGFVVAPGPPLDMAPKERAKVFEEGFFTPIRNAGVDVWREQFLGAVPMMVRDADRAAEIGTMLRRVEGDVYFRYLREMFTADLREGMATLRVPLLVLVARPDVEGMDPGMDMWREMLKGARNVTMTEVPDSRHFVMDDQPKEFDRLVVEFVEP